MLSSLLVTILNVAMIAGLVALAGWAIRAVVNFIL